MERRVKGKDIRRIGVLNRGEAAVRFIRAVREYNLTRGLELRTVAFYTDPDEGAPFVRMAHEDWSLGAAMLSTDDGPVSAYCAYDHVVRALRETGCDAVWPGWGFVSEDPEFVARLEREGIAFIGPPSSAMRQLGDKIEAKHLAEASDVPLAPWYPIAEGDGPGKILAEGERIGYPLMVKASAGGGGRGIRKVTSADDLVEAVGAVRAQVAQIFGQGGVMLEACVEQARHIEVQLVVGADGVADALGVRDCSIQRRHQKIIEETPSPVVDARVAQQLCSASARLAEAVGYRGVGTAEFLVRPETGQCCFLEVNSRLQVEHTITEAVYGVDLVHAQIDIARGLAWRPETLQARGWAIEARVNAEDPERGFQPSPGHVRVFRACAGPGIRVDSGVQDDMHIAPEFDSMIAKVIAWAPTRTQAVARLARALGELEVVVEDGATNKAFLMEVLRQDAYVTGSASTSWLDEAMAEGTLSPPEREVEALIAAAVLEYRRDRRRAIQRFFVEAQNGRPQNLQPPGGAEVNLRLRGRDARLMVYDLGQDAYLVGPEGALRWVRLEITGGHAASLWVGREQERRHTVLYAYGSAGISLEVDGSTHIVERASGGVVRSPAPAMVVHVAVEEGDRVEAGERLCTLEAMKLEMGVKAQQAGRVCSVLCRPNQQVASGQPLIVIEPEGEGTEDSSAEDDPFGDAEALALDRLSDGTRMDPQLLDALEAGPCEALVSELMATLGALVLGFDVPDEQVRQIEQLFRDDLRFALLRRPERWSWIVELLGTFVDTESLFDRDFALDATHAASMTADQAFFEYCRQYHEGEEGAQAELLPLLEAALARYGVRSLEPSEELREALWRLARSHQAGAVKHRLVSSLLRVLIQLHYGGVRFEPGLKDVVDRVGVVVGHLAPFVGDNARQARYVLFERSRYVRKAQELENMLDQALSELALSKTSALDALARSTWSVLPVMVQHADPSKPRALAMVEAIVKRLRRGERFARFEVLENSVGRSALGWLESGDALAVVVSRVSDLGGALTDLGERLSGIEANVVGVDVVVGGEAVGEAIGERVGAALEGVDAEQAGRFGAVVVTWKGARGMQHQTWRWDDEAGAWAEVVRYRGVHPHAAKRLEVDRLEAFELEALDVPDRIEAFKAQAYENARDERVFVMAEVGEDPEPGSKTVLAVGDEASQELFDEFAQAYYEAIRVLRDAQVRRPPRRRFHGNVMTFFIRPVVPLSVSSVIRVAKRLGEPLHRLGLSCVIVRATVPDFSTRSGVRDTEFVIRTLGRHRMEAEERAPSREPWRALSTYETRAIRARRMGYIYPYEMLWMLQGRVNHGEVPHPDMQWGRFVEYDLDDADPSRLVPVSRPYGENVAGVVVGVITNFTKKHPEGMDRVWIGSDSTRAMGALAEAECRRVMAALDLAASLKVPVEWVPVSAGAKIAMDSGTENLDWTARVLRKIVEFSQGGGEINLIVAGVNVGAQSYWNAEATMLMHTRGVLIMTRDGSMVLTGKKALDYSGGVSAEDERGIGGFERIMGPNGQAQYFAQDVGEAYAILFEHYRFTYVKKGERWPRLLETTDPADRSILSMPYPTVEAEPFKTVGEIFNDATNPGRKKPFAIREVMRAVVDQDGGMLERFGAMRDGESAVVCDAHIGGHAVCVIGVESRPRPRRGRIPIDGPDTWTGGTLFPQSSKKVARAINAASTNRPVVVLANLSGFDGSPESMRQLQLEHGAEIGRAVVNFDGPLIFAVIGRYHGGAYVVFSKGLNPQLRALALEGTYASVIGGAPAAAVVFPRQVRKLTDADPRIVEARRKLDEAEASRWPLLREQLDTLYADVMLEKRGEVARSFDAVHNVQRAVEVGSLDAVIPADQLRIMIIDELKAACERHGAPVGGAQATPPSVAQRGPDRA